MDTAAALNRFVDEFKIKKSVIAEKTGITPQALNKYFKGINTPSVDNIIKIADAFNVSTDYLLGRADNPNRGLSGENNITKVDSEKFNQALKLLMSSVKA